MPDKTRTKTTSLRWWWIGMTLAAIVWIGSKPLEQLTQQIQEIDQFDSTAAKPETEVNRFRACRYAAGTLGALSLTGLVWQTARRTRSNTNKDES